MNKINTNTNSVIVYKLGGTSQCVEGYTNLFNTLSSEPIGTKSIIVLSAISGVTNQLIKFTETKDTEFVNNAIAQSMKLFENIFLNLQLDNKECDFYQKSLKQIKKICDELELEAEEYKRLSDITDIYAKSKIIGFGEIISTNLLNIFLLKKNFFPQLLNSYDYIKSKKEIYQCTTQTEFYALPIDFNKFSNTDIFILQGYIGSTPSDKPILLGRGGSDTTGSLMAKTMGAKKYEVWTDVNGIYTGDPRVFESASIVSTIDYALCQELSAMGAKVMHPLSIKPCVDSKIPIYIRNAFTMDIGTCIKINNEQKETFYAVQTNQTLFKIKSLNMWNSHGFVSNIFRKFSKKNINIDIVTTSQFSITTTTTETNKYKLMEARDELKENYDVEMITDCVILSVVKKNIKSIINKINFLNIQTEMIHLSDNNMTLNLVLKEFNPEIIKLLKI
jgi:aspartate kinase